MKTEAEKKRVYLRRDNRLCPGPGRGEGKCGGFADAGSSRCKACMRKYNEWHYSRPNRPCPGVNGKPCGRMAEVGQSGCKKCGREKHMLDRYGLSPANFALKMSAQNGQCAICGKTLIEGKGLHIDHNHKTQQVRGLLCINCNHLIGSALESEEVLRNAAEYLRKWFIMGRLKPVAEDPEEFAARIAKRMFA